MFDGRLGPEDLTQAVDWARHPRTEEHPWLDPYDWTRIAGLTVDAYRAVAVGSRRTG
jgi:hypothetical protein